MRPRRSPRPKPRTIPLASIASTCDLEDSQALQQHRQGRPPTLVCRSGPGGYTLLLGATCWASARRRSLESIDTWIVPCSEGDARLIQQADLIDAPWPLLAQATALLRGHGLPAVALSAALGLDAAEISRLTAIGTASERLRHALSSGLLQPAHARLLVGLPHAAQVDWTERTLAANWSSRQLARVLNEADKGKTTQATPDLGAFETRLAERLGTEVRLYWPDEPAQRRLVLTWYGPEDLKGLLAQLASGPESSGTPPRRRELILPLVDPDELDALTGHLVAE